MKKIIQIILLILVFGIWGCKKDSDFLDVKPISILDNEQAFSDPAQVLSILANLYSRQVDFSTVEDWSTMADFSESFPSENGRSNIVQRNSWGFGEWGVNWFDSYAYIRELNLFLLRAEEASKLEEEDKSRFIAEARFLRANFYFEMVKRMGGVPLILEPMLYDFQGDPTYLQTPRAKESEIYDFIISEAEEIKELLPANANTKSRASKGAALAMEARAALYAGSIAKYGAKTPQVALPGGEVGIPADMADDYYAISLRAAQEIISGSAGAYALYNNPSQSNLAENF